MPKKKCVLYSGITVSDSPRQSLVVYTFVGKVTELFWKFQTHGKEEKKPRMCPTCPKAFWSEGARKYHMRAEHRSDTSPQKSPTPPPAPKK